MGWWGKLLGGTFGFMLGGPLGGLIGAVLGHNLDAGVERTGELPPGLSGFNSQERTQTAFFTASFSVMGHIAKADGRVTEDEIRMASGIMDQMALSGQLKDVAKKLFEEGKAPGFPLDEVLEQFRSECRYSRNLLRIFMELQLQAAYADGVVHPEERRILVHICEHLGLPPSELNHLEAMLRGAGAGAAASPSSMLSLDDAYAILDVSPESSDPEVKKAYRRLMSQHHPDKLIAKGLPEEMMKLATEKTQEIKAAYDRVTESRGA